jgi:DUF4097 and DUF4098 domain-containing protein YvlB
MRVNWTGCTIAGLTILISASHAAAQVPFQWHGRLASGQTIEIKGINGDVRATAASSPEVEVTATRTARRSNPDDVRIEVVPTAGGVTICAVYPAPPGREPNRCEPGDRGASNTRDNDTVVHFDVRVPFGAVSGESLQGDAEGHTVNGAVRLSTTARALASTVNGSVTATMGRTDWPNGASFTTVNGSITLTLPSAFDADLRAEMLSGSLTSDFPVAVTSSSESPRRLRGTIGNGGRALNLTTVNGGIRLLRAP